MATTESSSPSDSSQNAAFDPTLIPAPPLHGCQIRADMTFAEAGAAFDEWLSCPQSPEGARYRSKGTMRDNRTKIKALNKFFGSLKLRDIHIGHIREYQKMRFSNERNLWAHPAGADKINQEMGLQLRIMRLGNAYTSDIEKYYKTLQVDECEIPKALSQEEQERFLEVAASRPEWEVVHWYSLLALHIAFSSDEMRTLKQGDINLNYQIIAVRRTAGKNKHRRREVPLTDAAALWALERLLERSIALVGKSPEKYLFPARVSRGRFNGDFHMGETGMRKQFEAVREAAGLPFFCLNGWRHTAITRMAESGMAIAIIMARAGHCSPKMTAHYTHISSQAERLAMQSMTHGRRPTPRPPERPPQAPAINMMDPAIQAEIARQVALALHQEREERYYAKEQSGPRLVRFPGKGNDLA
jgi:integrase